MTGKELWRIKGTSMISVPTPFAAHDLIFCFTGYSRYIQPIYVVTPGSRGDITPPKDATSTEHVAWTIQRGAPYLPTPVVAGGKLYFANEDGNVYVLKAGPVYELLAQNHLGEVQMAMPAT